MDACGNAASLRQHGWIALVLIGAVLRANVAAAAPPALGADVSAGPSANCDRAEVSLQVTGIGDPVVQRLPLDVMIVFDRSGSMDDAGGSPPQPITDARNGAKSLVDNLDPGTDRAGLTSFASSASVDRELTSTLADVKSSIDALVVSGNTNIADGVLDAQGEMAARGRPAPTVRVLVVLSDGVANRRTTGSGCSTTPTAHTDCTLDAIDKAAASKAVGTYIFTIGLNLGNLPAATAAVARDTLQQMASSSGTYFEAPTSAQLQGIFDQIATFITTLAGSSIVVTHELPSGVSYVSGSASPAPTSVSGQTLTWNLGLLNIGSSAGITFEASVDPPTANQPVTVVPTSRVDYADYQSLPASVALPLATVSVEPCATSTPTATQSSTVTPTVPVTSTSTPTPTITSTAVATATPVPFCGDGIVQDGETCDDGNVIDGDGCESDCTPSTACSLIYPGTERFVGACGAPSHGDIQAAVDAASDGETITVCPGTYTEPVQVTRQVRVRAATPGTVTVHTTGTAFDVRRSGVAIENLTIRADGGAAVTADSICPLGQATCAAPGRGSNLTIEGNTISDSAVGIAWQRRIDCAQILDNTMSGNATHIAIAQQEGVPAVLVGVIGNAISGGGQDGAAVSLSGIGVTVAANTIADSTNAGLVLAALSAGSQVIENNIANNGGDGITVRAGAAATEIHDNNITDNQVGLGNESGAGLVDATLNWWDSQTGPSGLFGGVGDSIVNRGADSTTEFLEFLCKPFPQGFPSVLGLCSTETAELRQLVPGRAPDLDPFGRYIVFESSANMDVDARTAYGNVDASQEIFLLNRRPKKKLTGVCLGGLQPCDFTDLMSCTPCNGKKQCPGDPSADPIVLNGECVVVTQLTDGGSGTSSRGPRLTGLAKHVVFDSDNALGGGNPDGSREIARWSRPEFEKLAPPLLPYSTGSAAESFANPAPALNGKYIAVESNANPTGGNPDGNSEIFVYKPRSGAWIQVTNTLPPVQNRRPATTDGRRIVFDSTGDVHSDPRVPGIGNADGNRELFMARVKSSGTEIRQITDTVAPADTLSGSADSNSALVAFSSTANLTGQNADGSREVFTWSRRTGAFEQLTHATSGESLNPVVNLSQRFVVFESTADLTFSGATNRRIFQFDRNKGELLLLSRSRFGANQTPRIRKRRYVVWESTANLTGNNPGGDWVIYVFDRKKD